YWGYRPPPRTVNSIAWERTEAIAQALDRMLADPDREVRLAVLRRMRRERITTHAATLGRWLNEDHDPERVAAMLDSVRDLPAEELREGLWRVVADRAHSRANRLSALALWAAVPAHASERDLGRRVAALEDGPVLAEVLRQLSRQR